MNTPASDIEPSLQIYRESLVVLQKSRKPTAEQVLAVLTARDVLARALAKDRSGSLESQLEIVQLDRELDKQAGSIASAVKLAHWRDSLRPPSKAWWWSLDGHVPIDPADRFDWLWNALTILCFTASLSLVTVISNRFLSGGPDVWGAFATLFQVILTLSAAGGALTKAGQKAVQHIFSSIKVPARFHQEWKLIMSAILLILLVFLWFSLAKIARLYNNVGYGRYEMGELTSALHLLKRAVSLSPDYAEAHYNLGLVYEDLLEIKNAQTEYQIAMLSGLDAAYNNLARLYLAQDKPSEAIHLLLSGLEKAQDESVRYTMLKNLGWARVKQARYDDAVAVLREAIDLASDRAAAHCLLAQALAGQENEQAAACEWEACLKYGSNRTSIEEDGWIGQARQVLTTQTCGGQP